MYEHTYPFCWRCDTPLLYYARTTWYIRTTRVHATGCWRNNDQINWVPEHIKDGRFGNWLENNIDWALAPRALLGHAAAVLGLRQPGCGHEECIGSVAELGEKTGRKFMNPRYLAQQTGRWPDPDQDGEPLDLHRPSVDELDLAVPAVRRHACAACREVADAWFDSGSMPVAQWHYPFENQRAVQRAVPGRLHLRGDRPDARLVLHAARRQHAAVRPAVLQERHLPGPHPGRGRQQDVQEPRQHREPVGGARTRTAPTPRAGTCTRPARPATPAASPPTWSARSCGKFLLTLWNTYSFFVTYANLNDFDPAAPAVPLAERSVLDRWVLARAQQLVERVTPALETYDVTGATRPIADFVDELSNWYVRLSRRRFWNVGGRTPRASASAWPRTRRCTRCW